MGEEKYQKIGSTYYPRSGTRVISETEVQGALWRAWMQSGKYYLEFDEGHFSTKLRIVLINEEEFNLLKEGKISDVDLARKYG